jgi:lipid-A-disaccharide synthase
MKPNPNHPCVVIIAGEASGDHHGAKLVSAMRSKNPGLFFCGIGGPALEKAGVRIVVDAAELTVMGLTEVLSKLPSVLKGMGTIKRLLKSLKPELLILIDFPDFNLNIAACAKKLDIPVLFYVSPQIWAWRQNRVKRIGRLVDHMAVILPFEEEFYRKHHVPVTFVGHPLLDDDLPTRAQALTPRDHDRKVIGLVPGSRRNEVYKHLPVMLETADLLKVKLKHVTFIVSRASSVESDMLDDILRQHPGWEDIEVVSDGVEKVFARADAIIAASGTVTLQAAIHGTPMVIIYKVSPISALLARFLVRVSNVGLVNLVAGRELVPELLQDNATGPKITLAIERLLNDENNLNRLRHELIALRDALGGAGASDRLADIALDMIK